MAAIAQTIKRILTTPLRRQPQSAEGHFRIVRGERELMRFAFLLAHYGNRSVVMTQELLRCLWDLDTTALYVQLDRAASAADLVVTRSAGHRIVAIGQKFRVETQTHEPAPNGAYLVERQYRQLGVYETPPAERAVVVLRITAGAGRTYLVDVPHYVSHVTIVANDRVMTQAAPIARRGELRYHIATVEN
jgi:hypothetical protein